MIPQAKVGILKRGAVDELQHTEGGQGGGAGQRVAVDEGGGVPAADQHGGNDKIDIIDQLLTQQQTVDCAARLNGEAFAAELRFEAAEGDLQGILLQDVQVVFVYAEGGVLRVGRDEHKPL